MRSLALETAAIKIVHLTSVHPRFDTRIYYKMCVSAAHRGCDVSLVVADGCSNQIINGISIRDVGSSATRLSRILYAPSRIFAQAVAVKADIYHLHDPELIPIGIKLKRLGFRVIFDSHEDVPKQLLAKSYLPAPFLVLLSSAYSVYETWACARLDAVMAATPGICEKFLHVNANTVNINNFPRLDELPASTSWHSKRQEVCYVGGISKIRGIEQMCAAMAKVSTNVQLNLAGKIRHSLASRLQESAGWQRVNPLGFLDRIGVRDVLQRSVAGLVVLQPAPNYLDSLPVKMFEYMAAGIPVIASDFPLWRQIITRHSCGLLVDPLDPCSIAEAIDFLIINPDQAELMGRNGRHAVEQFYNWRNEEDKLMSLYELLIKLDS